MPFNDNLANGILQGGYLLFLLNREPGQMWSVPINEWEAAAWGVPKGTKQKEITSQNPTISLSVSYRVLRSFVALCAHDIGDHADEIQGILRNHRSGPGAYGNSGGDRVINASSRHTASALMIYFLMRSVGIDILTLEEA